MNKMKESLKESKQAAHDHILTSIQSGQKRMGTISTNAISSAKSKINQVSTSAFTSTERVVKNLNPISSLKSLKRRMIFGLFAGIFVYGFSTSIPKSIALYASNKEKNRSSEN